METENNLSQSGAQSKLILYAIQRIPLPMTELMKALDLKSKIGSSKRSINDLLLQELIECTIPEKPSSRLQKYRLTQKGKYLIENERGQ